MKNIYRILFLVFIIYESFSYDSYNRFLYQDNNDFYILNNFDMLSINFSNKNENFFDFGNHNIFLKNLYFDNKICSPIEMIENVPSGTKFNLKISGSQNLANTMFNFLKKSKNYLFDVNLKYDLLDYYNSSNNKNFSLIDQINYNNFQFNSVYNYFDSKNFIELSSIINLSNSSVPSLLFDSSIVNHNDEYYGKYSVKFGSEFKSFDLLGDIQYSHFNEKYKKEIEPVSFYPNYYNFTFDIRSEFNLSEKIKSNVFMNYYEDGLENFILFDNTDNLVRLDNEKISIGFMNEHLISSLMKLNYSAKIIQLKSATNNFTNAKNLILQDYKCNFKYYYNDYSEFNFNIAYTETPQLDVLRDISIFDIFKISGEYQYKFKKDIYKLNIFYNQISGFNDLSEESITNAHKINSIGLNAQLSKKIRNYHIKVNYSYNDIDNREIYLFNFISEHKLMLSLMSQYKFGLEWSASVNYFSENYLYDISSNKFELQNDFYQLNLKVGYQIIKQLKIFLQFNNATSSKFMYDHNLPNYDQLLIGGFELIL